jgi:hypothetical protein
MKQFLNLAQALATAFLIYSATLKPLPALGADCDTVWQNIYDAKTKIVQAFMNDDSNSVAAETENLVFWDIFSQIECSDNELSETPLLKLSNKYNQKISPGLAAYTLWLQRTAQNSGLDLTPAALVRGRTFQKNYPELEQETTENVEIVEGTE